MAGGTLVSVLPTPVASVLHVLSGVVVISRPLQQGANHGQLPPVKVVAVPLQRIAGSSSLTSGLRARSRMCWGPCKWEALQQKGLVLSGKSVCLLDSGSESSLPWLQVGKGCYWDEVGSLVEIRPKRGLEWG